MFGHVRALEFWELFHIQVIYSDLFQASIALLHISIQALGSDGRFVATSKSEITLAEMTVMEGTICDWQDLETFVEVKWCQVT